MASTQEQHHQELVNGLFSQLKEIFNSSKQAIYIYLDDAHKICNKRFASLLQYKSSKEWANDKDTLSSVDKKSQETLVSAYADAMEKMIGTTIPVTWKRKDGKKIDTNVILVPIMYNKHLLALHFVSSRG